MKLKHANSRVLNVIKINPYNFEICRFKFGSYFLRHIIMCHTKDRNLYKGVKCLGVLPKC